MSFGREQSLDGLDKAHEVKRPAKEGDLLVTDDIGSEYRCRDVRSCSPFRLQRATAFPPAAAGQGVKLRPVLANGGTLVKNSAG